MANAVPGPGGASDAHYDWFNDFAEEEPEVPAREESAFDAFASETRLIDRSTAIDSWATASPTPASDEEFGLADQPAFQLPRHGAPMRFVALGVGVVALAAWWIVPRLTADVGVPALPPQVAPMPSPPMPAPPPIEQSAPATAPAPSAAASPVAPAAVPPVAPAPATPAPVAAAKPDVAKPDVAKPAAPILTPEAIAANAAETPAIEATLGRYRAAFGSLDPERVADVFPAADRGSLARTFSGLTFQALEFDGCAIDVHDRDATASCRGRARVVTKAVAKTFLEPRRWEFTLRKDDRGWVIREVK
jgi:hypothetical protein